MVRLSIAFHAVTFFVLGLIVGATNYLFIEDKFDRTILLIIRGLYHIKNW